MFNISMQTGVIDSIEKNIINVKLLSNNQIINCLGIYSLNLDNREQHPNIKIETEVTIILIGFTYLILALLTILLFIQ